MADYIKQRDAVRIAARYESESSYAQGIAEALRMLMPEDVAPIKRAKWLWEYGIPTCSRCNKRPPRESIRGRGIATSYCPYCGAKMSGCDGGNINDN